MAKLCEVKRDVKRKNGCCETLINQVNDYDVVNSGFVSGSDEVIKSATAKTSCRIDLRKLEYQD